MATDINRFSARITQPKSQGASQAMLYATGMTDKDMSKAQVGIASVWIPTAWNMWGSIRLRQAGMPIMGLSVLMAWRAAKKMVLYKRMTRLTDLSRRVWTGLWTIACRG